MAFIERNVNGVVFMTSSLIGAPHAFTTRLGGVSEGVFSSLDLGENRGDREEDVRENYRRLCEACGFYVNRLVFSRQIHEDTVRYVTASDVHELFSPVPYDADGLITDEKDLTLTIFTADCVPVLLWDGKKNVVSAVHAGWRGTAAGIVRKAVFSMKERFGSREADIFAAVGPSIGQCCFETDGDVPEAMREVLGKTADDFITRKGEKYHIDLKGANARLLRISGLPEGNIDVSDECTMCLHEKYWSHRYTKGIRGSMGSFIMLEGKTT